MVVMRLVTSWLSIFSISSFSNQSQCSWYFCPGSYFSTCADTNHQLEIWRKNKFAVCF